MVRMGIRDLIPMGFGFSHSHQYGRQCDMYILRYYCTNLPIIRIHKNQLLQTWTREKKFLRNWPVDF